MRANRLGSLGGFLRDLRRQAGLTLRQVENATGGVVSNPYLSQLEHDRRVQPNPKYLVALSRVYGVSSTLLFEKAGYIEAPNSTALDVAFQQVLADATFKFGTRWDGELDDAGKRFIIELYERATGKRLLDDEQTS